MKTVRKGVFETNSSSSHSITVSKNFDNIDNSLMPDKYGEIHIFGGEYGWEVAEYNDAYTKASYAYQDRVPKELLGEVIMEVTGATKVKFSGRRSGYIDHQSSGTVRNELLSSDELKRFIFSKNSILYTDNDNH